MKKFICILLILLMCCGCEGKKEEIDYTYDIQSSLVDMSGYSGVNSTKHMFRGIVVDELYNVIDNKSSAVFYLGRTNCECCQSCVKYLNQVAEELGVTIYYIDVYNEQKPITSEDEINKLTQYLYDICDVVDGIKQLQTPTVFSVVNGELRDHLICLSNWDWDYPPTDKQIKKLKNKYTEILKPFKD